MAEITALTLPELRKKAMRLPLSPGVYLMKNKRGDIIYVGKAKALKNRVSQYFGPQQKHTVKVLRMVENVADFDFILTDSEFEALVLECSLIKQYSPKYNILLKDDKGYSYIKITHDGWPKISAALQKIDDGAEYIGPFTSHYSVSNSVDEALRIFRLPQCSRTLPCKDKNVRPCLNYHISRCCAPCSGKISENDYLEAVNDALDFLNGGSDGAVERMREQMETASQQLEFERAARLRDRINAITKLQEKQRVYCTAIKEQDVFAMVSQHDKTCLNVLRFSGGRLVESEYFIIDTPEDAQAARRELIGRFYSMRRDIPPRVSVDGDVEDGELVEQWLSSLAGKKVTLAVPQRGEQLRLIELCRKNAAEKLMQNAGRTSKSVAALTELAQLLGLGAMPEYIESYDISHTAGSDNVAGMVVFKNGVPCKRAYKRFAIKGFSGQDDYASMAEVLTRRFNHYFEEKDSDESEGFGVLPDLILLDGGTGQVNAVLPVLRSMGLDVPVFGMVKDNRHRTRAIAADGGELSLTSKRQAFTLVSTIQEEVHRFSVEYHRQKHKATGLSTTLTSINGIGEARAKALLKHFKTLSAIKQATPEQLCQAQGITKAAATAVYEAFHDNSNDS